MKADGYSIDGMNTLKNFHEEISYLLCGGINKGVNV